MTRDGHPVYPAVERWKLECLMSDGSIFDAGAIWTQAHIRELIEHFVENPDEGDRKFEEKLKDQLAPTSAGAKQLAAEMMWVMMLFPSNTGRQRKTELVRTIWDWSGAELRDPHHMFEAFERGVGSAGMGYNNYRPSEMFLLVRFAEAWKELSDGERNRLMAEPWSFADWFDRLPGATSRQIRHMLLHLLFPDTFERISSRSDKKRLEQAFASILQKLNLTEADRARSPMARDRRLYFLKKELERQYADQVIDFYGNPLIAARWRPQKDDETQDGPARISEPRPRFGPRVWAIAAGDGAAQWPTFREQGIVAIGWDELGDLRAYKSQDDLRDTIRETYSRDRDPNNDSLACYQFCREMRVGDEVFLKQGRNRILAHGRVSGEYEHDPTRPDFRNIRRVEWIDQGNWTLPDAARLPTKTLTEITDYAAIREFMREQRSSGTPVDQSPRPYSIDDVARDAFLARAELARILASLRRRKNVILQGSPGVGKSFLARRLAYALIGAESTRNVQLIQFHQSYSYEDFIQGWRPTKDRGFELKSGIFHSFCHHAQSHPSEPHVFIIDEINRGNLSKVFGELLLLIEADKRGPSFGIPLTYAESSIDTFYVPDNVYIIGLMNTADRSLAMVDYALRRRFAFITLQPAFDSPIFRQALIARGVTAETVDRVVDRVGRINQAIIDDDKNLGAGFAIGHSYFCPTSSVPDSSGWYESVVRDEIAPLLEEYWFDNRGRVDECLKVLLS